MKRYLSGDEWNIEERKFKPEHHPNSESLFSLGNGHMGQRANFEETYSGPSLQGNYLAGVYYPDKTRVGWWKNGYPEYFAKILNAPNWIGIHIKINGTPLDLAKIPVSGFRRILDMKEGTLKRSFTAHFPENTDVEISVVRFLSMADDETGAIRYMLRPLSGPANISLAPYLDADVKNEESNYGEKFWEEEDQWANDNSGIIQVKTKKLDFRVATGITCQAWIDGSQVLHEKTWTRRPKYLEKNLTVMADKGNEVILYKFAAILSSLYYSPEQLIHATQNKLQEAVKTGFEEMLISHQKAWAAIWKEKDFLIHGDLAAQQGIRFNIFQLHQTYTGKDERLNIGPKGFTGEKYGGSTYWDTEAFAFPFYLYSGKREIARNLLLYRYRHLPKAIDNAGKLGFIDGAALYPMVTMNGEECHNEWEITFEEIHRNGAIAYAIHKYINYTGRYDYLFDYGLEVLIALSRFWSQRVNYSEPRHKYVILGVTGPNEYENNVNNNWYTNYIARWTLLFSLESVEKIKQDAPDKWKKLIEKVRFREKEEISNTPVQVSKSKLYITSNPRGADVFINGKFYGRTPIKIEMDAGKYKVSISKNGYKSYEEDIAIKKGTTKKVAVTLVKIPAEGIINIYTVPTNAEIYINGKLIGISPIYNYHIYSGEYSILIKKENYLNYLETLKIEGGQERSLVIELEPIP